MKFLTKLWNFFTDKNKIVRDYPEFGYRYVESVRGKVYIVITDQVKYSDYCDKLAKQLIRTP